MKFELDFIILILHISHELITKICPFIFNLFSNTLVENVLVIPDWSQFLNTRDCRIFICNRYNFFNHYSNYNFSSCYWKVFLPQELIMDDPAFLSISLDQNVDEVLKLSQELNTNNSQVNLSLLSDVPYKIKVNRKY